MLRGSEMPDRVLVLGRIATADVSALHAHPELHPDVAQRHAVGATRSARWHVAHATDVRARHWVFGLEHNESNVRTAYLCVESIDGMGFMSGMLLWLGRGSPTEVVGAA